tara:strand:- start:142 stop:303 length:162 start_codon:yes stop_codon:yes gene_type:complete
LAAGLGKSKQVSVFFSSFLAKVQKWEFDQKNTFIALFQNEKKKQIDTRKWLFL